MTASRLEAPPRLDSGYGPTVPRGAPIALLLALTSCTEHAGEQELYVGTRPPACAGLLQDADVEIAKSPGQKCELGS